MAEMVKPFQPPTVDMCLRFRYTTYMGEQHPAEKKVVLEFSPADMPNLTDLQRDKLRKLVGVRYNPEEDLIKMSCESFETQAQNKRYLGDLVDKLLVEARVSNSPDWPDSWLTYDRTQRTLLKTCHWIPGTTHSSHDTVSLKSGRSPSIDG